MNSGQQKYTKLSHISRSIPRTGGSDLISAGNVLSFLLLLKGLAWTHVYMMEMVGWETLSMFVLYKGKFWSPDHDKFGVHGARRCTSVDVECYVLCTMYLSCRKLASWCHKDLVKGSNPTVQHRVLTLTMYTVSARGCIPYGLQHWLSASIRCTLVVSLDLLLRARQPA